MKATALILTATLLLGACKKTAPDVDWTNKTQELYSHNGAKVSIKEGLAGTVTMKEGNCMPVIGPNSTCKEFPVKRKVMIYEKTDIEDLKRDGNGEITEIKTKLLATVESDKEGFYQIPLKTGTYSVFLEEKGKPYFSSTSAIDLKIYANPVTIEDGKTTIENLRIDYAVY